MKSAIIVGVLIIGYLLIRVLTRKHSNDRYLEILSNDKYKVKGQWGR